MTTAILPRRSRHALTAVVAGLVALLLPLVAPVDSPRASVDHAFQLVHAIFAHHHQHGDGDPIDDVGVAVPLASLGVIVIPPIPAGPGPLTLLDGMLLPALPALLGLPLLLTLARRERPLADQTSVAVPTGPPR
jgi:hypothetical protein